MVFESLASFADMIFNPILSPLLTLPSWLGIFIVAAAISIISVFVQKHFTNQERLKFLKKEMKKLQAQIRKNKDNQEKQLKIHKKMMPMQGEMMKESIRPTLWMMIPFTLVFFWLAANFAFGSIEPNTPFFVEVQTQDTATVEFALQEGITLLSPRVAQVNEGLARFEMTANAGEYALLFTARNTTVEKNLVVTNEKEYATPEQRFDGPIQVISIDNPSVKPFGNFSIFGWRPGWIATYIFFSLVLSIGLRKLLDVA